jgi:lipid-binding SYLF domain-containing protein
MRCRFARAQSLLASLAAALLFLAAESVQAQTPVERQLTEASELIRAFSDGGPESIPTELLQRARGIAVVPQVFRGGFILGARRGRGVLSIRMPDGSWSNPAFITLTGGSIGWQIGAESTDIVLVFANDNAVKNIATGKFTLGGEATAVAGPLRKQASSSMTFRAEVYGYIRSRGLYAGAAFQGAKLHVDEDLAAALYGDANRSMALAASNADTPLAARDFLQTLDSALVGPVTSGSDLSPVGGAGSGPAVDPDSGGSEALTFPLPD